MPIAFALLAQTSSSTDEKLEKLLSGFGNVVFISAVLGVFLFLILCLSLARRMARRRKARIEEELAQRHPTNSEDLWSEAGERVEVEPKPQEPPEDDQPWSENEPEDW